jgi:hypothetical protein
VTRRDFRVFRYPLVPEQAVLLRSLQQGEPVGEAIAQAAGAAPDSDERLLQNLRDWFFQWTAAGLFRDVVVD